LGDDFEAKLAPKLPNSTDVCSRKDDFCHVRLDLNSMEIQQINWIKNSKEQPSESRPTVLLNYNVNLLPYHAFHNSVLAVNEGDQVHTCCIFGQV
jgi:hypothetical protein